MKVLIDPHALENLLGPMVKQAAFVAQKAINDTLFQARKDTLHQMKTHIDGGPTTWTKRSLRYKKASKNYLQGTLYFNYDRPYMKTIIDGGTVKANNSQYLVVPKKGKMNLTKQGNIRRGRVRALANKPNYFVGTPGNSKDMNKRGLYKIKGRGKKKKLERMTYQNQTERKARTTYAGPELAERFIKRKLQGNILKAAKRAIATAR